jgi:WD40 repeat protein
MELKYIDCATNDLDVRDIFGMFIHENYLLINQRMLLSVWDISDIRNIKNVYTFSAKNPLGAMKRFGTTLFFWRSMQDDIIVALDISNPLNIKQLFEIKLQNRIQLSSLVYHNDKILATGRKNIYEILKDGSSQLLFETENSNVYDMIAHKNVLISAGSDDGFRFFELDGDKLTLLKHITTQFAMTTSLSWAEPGKTLLVLGNHNEGVMKIDVSNPAKAKRGKNAKTGIGLGDDYVREGDTLLILGSSIGGSKGKMAVVEVNIAGEIPEVIKKYDIKGYYEKYGSDSPRGILRVGNYLLLAAYDCQLGVVEIV